MKTKWKIIASLLAIVLVSGAAGAVIGAKYTERTIRQRNTPEAWNLKAMRALRQRLKPGAEQEAKMQRIVDHGVEDLKAIRIETIARTDAVVERMIAEIEKDITPGQRAEFEKLRRQRGSTTLDLLKVEPRNN